jgi:hypothetical protein
MDTATSIRDRELDERALHQRMEWFFKKYAPADKYEAAEFHADLMMVVQAVHQDASRHTHDLLTKALAIIPYPTLIAPDSHPSGAPPAAPGSRRGP